MPSRIIIFIFSLKKISFKFLGIHFSTISGIFDVCRRLLWWEKQKVDKNQLKTIFRGRPKILEQKKCDTVFKREKNWRQVNTGADKGTWGTSVLQKKKSQGIICNIFQWILIIRHLCAMCSHSIQCIIRSVITPII